MDSKGVIYPSGTVIAMPDEMADKFIARMEARKEKAKGNGTATIKKETRGRKPGVKNKPKSQFETAVQS